MPLQTPEGKKLLIFLSHAREDKPRVRRLCQRLRVDGFDPWLDEERLLPGQDWNLEIERAMRASGAILLCFSALSTAKEGYIQREYKRAMQFREEKPEGTIFLIPVRLDDCELPSFIQGVQWVDYPGGYKRLVQALNLRAGPPPAQVQPAAVKKGKKKLPASRKKPEASTYYIHAGRDVVMGDQHNFTASLAHLDAQLEQIIALLRQPGTTIQISGNVRDSIIVAGEGNSLRLSRADIDGLAALQAGADAGRRTEIYLTSLLLRDTYAPWEHLYVPLAGNMLIRPEFEDLPVRYSEYVVPVKCQSGQGQPTMRPLKDITEAIDSHPAFIILGAPGAGKTTTLQKIAFETARARLQKHSGLIPLFVRLSEQRERDPYGFLQTEWERSLGTPFAPALQAGQILILADGVNEITRESRPERLKEWRNFNRDQRGNNLLVFSGRFLDYGNELDLPRVLVEPLGKDQIIDFLKRHKAGGLAFRLDEYSGRLLEIARNPLNLLVLVTLYKINPDQSFTNLGRLFQAFCESLCNREQAEHPAKMPLEVMRRALAQMAFAMQEQGEGLTFAIQTARQAVPETVDFKGEAIPVDPARLFDFGRGATILDPATDVDVRFRHHVLQEYFAALELLRRFDENEDLGRLWRVPRRVEDMPPAAVGEWDPLPEPPAGGWEVTTILACGLAQDPAGLIEAVRRANPALAGRCLDEAGIEQPEAVLTETRQDLLADLYDPTIHLRARLQAGFILGRIGDPRFQPREVNGVKVILPEMLPVPGGTYLIGSAADDKDAIDGEHPQHQVELPAFWIGKWPVTNAEYACFMAAGGYQDEQYWQTELAKRWLKGEDVAGGQFKAWLDIWKALQKIDDIQNALEQTGNFPPEEIEILERVAGLSEGEFMSWVSKNLGEKSRSAPEFWDDPRYNNPSQPVVGVTWFEAQAYCAWLSAVRRREYRLPAEVEWEAAARGRPARKKARLYPWGEDWEPGRANSLEGRVLKPSPVGAYAAAGGNGPFGAEDQSGNVWNWTSSLYLPYPCDPAKSELPEAEGERVLRGGSWNGYRRNVRCAYRLGSVPVNFDLLVGFRLFSPGSYS